jgi:hypothetical protein
MKRFGAGLLLPNGTGRGSVPMDAGLQAPFQCVTTAVVEGSE